MADDEEDIVAELREAAKILPHDVYNWLHPLLTKAANEIEKLDKEIDEMKDDAWNHGVERDLLT